MNKRGQIYILAAILFGFTLATLTSKINYAVEKDIEDNFKELSENYDIESSKFINSLLEGKQREEVLDEISLFTQKFAKFAKNQNPDFGLIFLIPYDNALYVENFLNSTIIVDGKTVNRCGGVISYNDIFIAEGFYADISIYLDQLSEGRDVSECITPANFPDRVNIRIGDVSYDFEVSEKVMEIVVLSKEDKGKQRKVFLNNKIVPGELVNE